MGDMTIIRFSQPPGREQDPVGALVLDPSVAMQTLHCPAMLPPCQLVPAMFDVSQPSLTPRVRAARGR
ncbi:MAG: hypothetical protein NVS2B16_30510 [Chloroflexota bacterium]